MRNIKIERFDTAQTQAGNARRQPDERNDNHTVQQQQHSLSVFGTRGQMTVSGGCPTHEVGHGHLCPFVSPHLGNKFVVEKAAGCEKIGFSVDESRNTGGVCGCLLILKMRLMSLHDGSKWGKHTDEEEVSEHLLVLQATTSYLVSASVLL